MSSTKRSEGVVILPIVGMSGNDIEMMIVVPQDENKEKLGEMCPIIPGATMEPLAGMFEFPGGAVDKGEDTLAAARREFESESGIVLDSTFEHRFLPIFEGLEVDQLRPDLTYFSVAVGLLLLKGDEISAMERGGASRVLVDMRGNGVRDLLSGENIFLRPAHAAIIYYMTNIIRSLIRIEESAYA